MKRWISYLLCLCFLSGLFGINAFAAESDAEAMRQVLLAVKSRITIPDEFSEFNYHSEIIDKKTYWQFFWENGSDASISVEADAQGRIKRYQHSFAGVDVKQIPKVTRAQAENLAQTLLKTMLPEIAQALVLQGVQANQYNNTYRISYVRHAYGVPIPDQSVSLQIDYCTGTCKSLSSSIDYETAIPKPGALIDGTRVREQWKEMAQLKLMYTVEENGEARLWYLPTGEIRPVIAETGEILEKDIVWEEGVTEDSMSGGGGTNNKTETMLSPKEQEKREELSGLLSKAAADAAVRKHSALALESGDTLYSAYLYHDAHVYGSNGSVVDYWSLEYSGPVTKGENPQRAYACVDAKTGELLSFRAYRDSAENSRRVKKSTAEATAKNLLRSVAGTKLQQLGAGEYLGSESKKLPAEYEFKFSRIHQEIPVSNNWITVTVNSVSGKVTHYSRYWTEVDLFVDPTKVIGLDTANEALVNHETPKLEYATQTVYLYAVDSDSESVDWYYSGIPTEKRITLCYIGASGIQKIDALTGEVHQYGVTGSKDSNGTYSDIKGYFAEEEIQLLLDIGVLPAGEKFEPNKQLTQAELLSFLILAQDPYRISASNTGYSLENLYQMAIERGILSENERNPAQLMMRSDVARIAIRCTGFAELAKDFTIFRVNYRDVASIPQKNLGYVAIAKALGIMTGNNGLFYPTRVMTRGEAACMICRLLSIMN